MQARPRTRPMPVTSPAPGRSSLVHPVRRERRELEERRARIEQGLDALARQQLARLRGACRGPPRLPPSALRCNSGAQLRHQGLHGGAFAANSADRVSILERDLGHRLLPAWCQSRQPSGTIVRQSDYPTILGPMTMGFKITMPNGLRTEAP